MSAVQYADQLDKSATNKLGPCPADERVAEFYDVPAEYEPGVRGGKEGEIVGEDGITRQRCGGGHRVIKKRIGGGS